MGQTNQKNLSIQQNLKINEGSIDEYIKYLFQATSEMTFNMCIVPINAITFNITQKGSSLTKQGKLYYNPTIIKCIFHKNFKITIQNLLKLLISYFQKIQNRSLSFTIHRSIFQQCLIITNFCLYFTNQTLLQKISLLYISSDVHEDTKKLMYQLQVINQRLNHKIFQNLPKQLLTQIIDSFTNIISYSINIRHKILSRSTQTFNIIDRLTQTLFIILAKLTVPVLQQLKFSQEVHNHRLIIGSFFLGYSIQKNIGSIYQIANQFLLHQLKMNFMNINNGNMLPVNYFKHLPIVNNSKLLNWIIIMLLHSLCRINQGQQIINKLNVNRMSAFILLNYCIDHIVEKDKHIQYLIKEVCLHTKIAQIQRLFVSKIALSYSKLSEQEIIHNYAKLSEQKFIIKVQNKRQEIQPSSIIQYFNNIKTRQNIENELERLQCRYITQIIFHKGQVIYDYSDKILWSEILTQIKPELLSRIDQLSISNKDSNQ